MDRQYIVDINQNDELQDVIRKTNTNFRLLKNHIANKTSEISANIDIDMDDITDALDGIIYDFTNALSEESQARRDKDSEIENGYCPIDSNGLVPSSYLPSYVDDVIEAYPRSGAAELGSDWLSLTSDGVALTPETGKIYVLLSSSANYQANSQFRWGGSAYANITSSGADGITPSVSITSITGGHNVAFEYGSGDPRNADFDVMDGADGANGTNGTDGADGADGADGVDGADGITPTVAITAITGGHNVAFDYGSGDPRNADFDIMDGTGAVSGVKGDAEQTYRTGNVNLTPANIGTLPAYARQAFNEASDETDLPTLPCAVIDTDTAMGYWCDSDGIRKINHAPMTWETVGGMTWALISAYTWGDLRGETRLLPPTGGTMKGDLMLGGEVRDLEGNQLYADASHTHTDYLPLSGGVVTGSFGIESTTIDRDAAAPSSDQWADNYGMLLDKDDELIGQLRMINRDGGIMSFRLGVFTEDTSNTTVSNTIELRIAKDGTRSYYIADPAAFRSAISALATSGGIMTGAISMNNSPIDRDGANPSSVQYGQNMVVYGDKDNETIGYIQPKRMSDGRIGIQLTAVNENTSGNNVYNTFSLYAAKNGTFTYEVSSPGNFRSAIGLTTSVTSSLTNTGVTITAKSGFTVTVTSVRSYGNVRTVFGNIKSTSAWTAGQQINPFTTNLYSSVVSSDFFYGDVAASGNAWLRVAAATSANTARDFTMVGIL